MKPIYRHVLLSCSVAVSAFSLARHALAADFTIINGQTVTTTQTLNPGEVGTVQDGGTIDVSGARGIVGNDGITVINDGVVKGNDTGIFAYNNNSITNSGHVIGTGFGITTYGSNNTTTNSGTAEGYYFGIQTLSDSTITNSGTARGTSAAGAGILAYYGNTVVNSGTAESGLYGMYIYNDNTVLNSGTAQGGVIGIYALYDDNVIANSGDSQGAESGIRARDGNTIDNSGTTTGGSRSGIEVNNNNTINNSGSASGTGSSGISVNNFNTVTNSGTAEGGRFGIYAFGNVNTITNSGTAKGVDNHGIYANGSDNIITNTGMAEGEQHGIFASGSGNTITNAATAQGEDSGLYASGPDNTIINTGMAKGGDYGIISEGANSTVTNTGTAEGGDYGIFTDDSGTTINSGRIVGGIGAVALFGSGHTLKLLQGSIVEGNLELGKDNNTLVIGRGLDTALAFTGTPTIETDGVPFVVIDSTVYAVNVTGFSVQDEMANDLTRAVTGAVEGRLAAARLTGGGLSMAMNGMTIAAAADVSVAPQNGVWLSGLSAYRDQEENGDVVSFESGLAGVVAGFDGMVTDTSRAGLFGGFSAASLDAEDDPLQGLDSDSWFGGVYLGHAWGQAFLDLTLTAGWSEFDSSRRVANNMVVGGIEHAEADYGGFLLSPSVRFGTDMEMGSGIFTPSLRLRYAGLFLEGYEESGSAAALEVDARNISIFDVRGELAYGFALGDLQNTLRVGIDGTLSNADDAEATLAGQALDIDVAEDNLARGFIGYDADYALSDSASLTLSTEAGYDTAEALTLEARAGFSWTF